LLVHVYTLTILSRKCNYLCVENHHTAVEMMAFHRRRRVQFCERRHRTKQHRSLVTNYCTPTFTRAEHTLKPAAATVAATVAYLDTNKSNHSNSINLNLPPALREHVSLAAFKSKLKTYAVVHSDSW